MRKGIKILFGIMCCAAFFISGIIIGKHQEKTGLVRKSIISEEGLLKADITVQDAVPEKEADPIGQDVLQEEEDNGEDVANEEELFFGMTQNEFLEEHLFGQWRFVERVIDIQPKFNFYHGADPNISDVGVEELKRTVLLYYSSDSVELPINIGQNSFTHPQDMYLFAAYGGFMWTSKPVYALEYQNRGFITLANVYDIFEGYRVWIDWMDGFVHVHYYVPAEIGEPQLCGDKFTYFGRDIYIDPEDTDTIYIDFCGLWRMERDDTYYGTNGKSEY